MEGEGNHRRDLGRIGEDIACDRLKAMGHVILERNWRSRHLEIDIISFDPDGIHFVEVKTRKQSIQAPPQENVDKMKQKRIIQAAKAFMKTRSGMPYGDHECHFDIMAVTFGHESFHTEWFPQAYLPIYF